MTSSAPASVAALAHVFVGTNAISNALCSNSTSTIALGQPRNAAALIAAFAAKNAVALVTRDAANPELLRICEMLQHRSATNDAARITSVLLHAPCVQHDGDNEASSTSSNGDGSDRVLAGDSEGHVFLWQRLSAQQPWQLATISSDVQPALPTASVAAVAAVETRRRWLYFASYSDGTLVAFEHAKQLETRMHMLARLDLGVRRIVETLAATTIRVCESSDGDAEARVLLAAGGVDCKVHLFEVASGSNTVTPLLALEGHRGWIRSLAFEQQQHVSSGNAGGDAQCSLLLASASQDQRIRLWQITAQCLTSEAADEMAPEPPSAMRSGFHAAGAHCAYSVNFDALLVGHEDWVTSVQWTLVPRGDASSAAPLKSVLVSASMDNALVVWERNPQRGAWDPALRVGEMAGNGLLRGVVLPSASDRLELLALGFGGALERWQQEPAPSTIFRPALSLTGHCAAVTDLAWSPAGDYVLSVSLDQTARVLAPMQRGATWLELSRAQVHGYDLNCACFLLGSGAGGDSGGDRFVSGADEKILRVFEAPDDVQTLVRRLARRSSSKVDEADKNDAKPATRVQHAYLPELSLTNKSAADAAAGASTESYAVVRTSNDDTESALVRVPVGETLAKKTLWPELRKLYGHGNELLCVVSNHAGSLLASACKSREERFAGVWLWRTHDWGVAQTPLEGPKSSVVQLAFAPNDALLLAVSRDRHVCVYERRDASDVDGDGAFALAARIKAHKRIVWSCSWSPDSRFFATASRDQSFALWGRTPDASSWCAAGVPTLFDSAVTAVAFAPASSNGGDGDYTLAVGLESGAIQFFRVAVLPDGRVASTHMGEVAAALAPSASITRLAWSPVAHGVTHVLAAASADHCVRLYSVSLSQ